MRTLNDRARLVDAALGDESGRRARVAMPSRGPARRHAWLGSRSSEAASENRHTTRIATTSSTKRAPWTTHRGAAQRLATPRSETSARALLLLQRAVPLVTPHLPLLAGRRRLRLQRGALVVVPLLALTVLHLLDGLVPPLLFGLRDRGIYNDNTPAVFCWTTGLLCRRRRSRSKDAVQIAAPHGPQPR